MLSRFSCVQLFATPWTIVLQALLSMGFSRQEYWSGLPFPSPVLGAGLQQWTDLQGPSFRWEEDSVGGKKVFPKPVRVPSWVQRWGWQRQINREKYTDLCNISCVWHENLHKEMKTRRNEYIWWLYARFDEKWKAVGKMIGQRLCARDSTLGKTWQGPFIQIPLNVFHLLGMEK